MNLEGELGHCHVGECRPDFCPLLLNPRRDLEDNAP